MFVSKTLGSSLLNRPINSNFKNTSSGFVLHGDDLVGINNNAQFIGDKLSNTFVPFQSGYSNHFNGSSYFTVTNNIGLQFGTDDFTIEAWIYNQSSAAAAKQIFCHWGSSATNAYQLFLRTNNRITWQIFNQAAPDVAALDVPVNTWTHVAWSKKETTAYLFINGVLKDTTTGVTNSANGNATNPWIGTQNGSQYWNGYISNLRITKGYALYTADFTPQTTSLTSVPGTTLLACQSSKLVDNALNTTLTMTGTVAVSAGGNALMLAGGRPAQGVFSPFSQNGWANFFNSSTSDYISAPNNSQFQIDAAFTAECWVYAKDVLAASNYGIIGYHAIATGAGSGGWILNLSGSTNGTLVFNTYSNNSAAFTSQLTSAANALTANQWNHIAVSYDGTTYRLFVNGNIVDSSVSIGSITYTGAVFNIGRWNYSSPRYFNGYISNVRFVNGSALYTDNFTPSVVPLTAVSGTQLLTCQSNKFKDNSTNNLTLTLNGTPSVQAFSPFTIKRPYNKYIDGSSCYFNGSSDYISSAAPGTLYQFGTSNWTIEAWIYPTSTATTQTIYQIYGTTLDNLNIQYNGTTKAVFTEIRGTNQTAVTATSTVLANLNEWNHVVLTRDSTTNISLYVNGQLGATQAIASTTTFVDTQFAQNPTIGAKTNVVANYFTGFISNLRVVSGTAVYTGAFTPPTSPVLPISGTVQLTNFDNANVIDSTGKYNFCQSGAAATTGGISTAQYKFGGSSLSFNGSSDFINFGPPFSIGANPYTFECWFYLNNTTFSAFYAIIGYTTAGITNSFNLRLNSTTVVQIDQQGTAGVQFTIPALRAGQWYHLAVTRDASNLSNVWLNGTRSSTGATSITANYSGITNQIGAQNGANFFPGYLDDIRFTPYTALYTANFTPPSRKFEDR